MSRQPYQWDKAQILKATRMWYDNVAKRVIAEEVGISQDTLQYALECGELCQLPKRKQGSGRKKCNRDDEALGILFGVADWKDRAAAVRMKWNPGEAYKRRHGHTS